MVEWAATVDEICGYGQQDSVVLAVEGWQPTPEASTLPGGVDAAVSGTTDAICLPAGATATDADGRLLQSGTLSDGDHRIVAETAPEVWLAFEGSATVERKDRPWIHFPEPNVITVGFREVRDRRPEVHVPETPSGLATAVSAAGRTHRTTGPARSHPGFRPRTPRVVFGDHSIPEPLEPSGSAPRMVVPDSALSVLVAAPLAYYVGATLRVNSGPPRILGDDIEYTFDSLPAFTAEISRTLRGLCSLDARLRSIPGETGPLGEASSLAHLEDASPAERLAELLDSPPETLPEWPLSTYVEDDPACGRYLPYLLDRLSLVHPATSSTLDPEALLKRSLDEFYRGDTPDIDAVDPSLADSRFHAWLGEGTPVDAYTLFAPETPPQPGSGGEIRIDVVCNEPEMASERGVADVYRSRLAGRNVEVRVHECLTTGDLAAVFEGPTDLVHFIGHCEVGGIVCPDGELAAADLEACRAEAFFLNACGSYYEGYDLVRRGATVGAVTLSAVLDEQAVTLGTTFAELLAAGYAFDRALSLARGEIIVGRDYVVVGDGTHRLSPPCWTPGIYRLRADGEEFTLRYEATAPDSAGRRYLCPFDGRERLCGETAMTKADRESISSLLADVSAPVRYDGDLYWSEEIPDVLAPTGQQS